MRMRAGGWCCLVVAMALSVVVGCGGSDEKSGDVSKGVDVNVSDVSADIGCVPDCAGKSCGDDGCGGVCGKCFTPEGAQDDTLCTDAGTCCVPACAGNNCGDNGCDGLCGECKEGIECLNGQCADTCVPDCGGKDCGDDGCAGSCGNCLDKSGAINNELCMAGICCVPNCKFKQCGDDGCSGSCGSCEDGLTCEGGVCADVCVPDCDGYECGYDGCTGSCGTCTGGDVCKNHLCVSCDPDCAGKDCGGDGCGGLCGSCDVGTICEEGNCVCVPQCADAECGDDTCGGSCGECDDGNPCTADTCETGACVFELLPVDEMNLEECLCAADEDCADLEDNDICNGTLICDMDSEPHVCQVDLTSIPECDDKLPCTDDVCDPESGCTSVPDNDNDCADADVCNGEEYCETAVCKDGEPLDCDDENPCTDEVCDPVDGCVVTSNDANPCDDGDVCNGLEECSDGACLAGSLEICNDENPCTDDGCDPVDGCVYTNNDTNSCDDDNACNGDETCSAGDCVAGQALVCDDDDVCNGTETCSAGDGCVAGTPLDCDDDDDCTTDSCDSTDGCDNAEIPNCPAAPTWIADIKPVVLQKCSPCHVGGGSSGGLKLDTIAFKDQPCNACAGKTRGEAIALKIHPDWNSSCSGARMPVGGPYLSAEIQQLFADWVAGGMQE